MFSFKRVIALFLCGIILLSFPTTSNAAGKFVVTTGRNDVKAIALTFDDGGKEKEIYGVLDALDKYKVKGTFFLNGKFIDKNPELTKAIADRGHEVANHTYIHLDLKKLDKKGVLYEANATAEAFKKATGKDMAPYIRPPYGSHNEAVDKILSDAGYKRIVLWDVDTLDWKKKSKDQIVAEAKRKLAPGRIILMHILPKLHTYEALPEIIEHAQSEGYKIMTISEILEGNADLRVSKVGKGHIEMLNSLIYMRDGKYQGTKDQVIKRAYDLKMIYKQDVNNFARDLNREDAAKYIGRAYKLSTKYKKYEFADQPYERNMRGYAMNLKKKKVMLGYKNGDKKLVFGYGDTMDQKSIDTVLKRAAEKLKKPIVKKS